MALGYTFKVLDSTVLSSHLSPIRNDGYLQLSSLLSMCHANTSSKVNTLYFVLPLS